MTLAPERPADPPAGPTRTVHDLPNPRHGWWRDAACKGMDTEAWIVAKEESTAQAGSSAAARRVCLRCPVQRDCLLDAVQSDDRRSIRAGMGVAQRDRWLAEQGVRRPGALEPPRQHTGTPRGPYRTFNVDRMVELRRAEVPMTTIAAELGCSEATVARRLAAARKAGLL